MKKTIAIYPGTFDPLTNGHLDLLVRASRLFDQVIIAIAASSNKNCFFSLSDRLEMVRQSTKKITNVKVESFSGLLVQYAAQKKAHALIRGLRAVSDFEYEFQMALMNRKLCEKKQKIETVYLTPDEKFTYLSSSTVKEVARLGGNVKEFVPAPVFNKLQNKLHLKLNPN